MKVAHRRTAAIGAALPAAACLPHPAARFVAALIEVPRTLSGYNRLHSLRLQG
jgi:hypothetical protein